LVLQKKDQDLLGFSKVFIFVIGVVLRVFGLFVVRATYQGIMES